MPSRKVAPKESHRSQQMFRNHQPQRNLLIFKEKPKIHFLFSRLFARWPSLPSLSFPLSPSSPPLSPSFSLSLCGFCCPTCHLAVHHPHTVSITGCPWPVMCTERRTENISLCRPCTSTSKNRKHADKLCLQT